MWAKVSNDVKSSYITISNLISCTISTTSLGSRVHLSALPLQGLCEVNNKMQSVLRRNIKMQWMINLDVMADILKLS